MKFPLRAQARIAHAAITRDVPVYAHWGVTHRCNLRCKMCGIWRYGDESEELSLDQVRLMAERMGRMGVAHLTLGGGEPFVRPDLPEVVRAFVSHGIAVRVLTNGVLDDPSALDRVVDAGGIHFSVSLDSLSPARHDEICQQEGAWHAAVKTMVRIAELTHDKGGMPLLNTVVSNANLEELPRIIRFADALGFTVSLLPVELLEDPRGSGKDWEDRFIRFCPELAMGQDKGDIRERITAAYDRVVAMKREGFPVLNTTPYLKASRDYLLDGVFPPFKCDAGKLYFSVAPNGQFTICHRTVQQHRSILDDDFEDYWKSQVYETARREEVASCEGCMRACWIDTSFIFRTRLGFMETTKTALRPRKVQRIPTYEEMLGWARPSS